MRGRPKITFSGCKREKGTSKAAPVSKSRSRYVNLVLEAIGKSDARALTLTEIYASINGDHPEFKMEDKIFNNINSRSSSPSS